MEIPGPLRTQFARQIAQIQQSTLAMMDVVAFAWRQAITALVAGDTQLAQTVLADIAWVRAERDAVQQRCIEMLALQAPVAGDLRAVFVVQAVAGDLVNAGTFAAEIAGWVEADAPVPLPPSLFSFIEIRLGLFEQTCSAYHTRDAALVGYITANLGESYGRYHEAIGELEKIMLGQSGRAALNTARFIFVAQNVNRLTPYIITLCESTRFLITGRAKA